MSTAITRELFCTTSLSGLWPLLFLASLITGRDSFTASSNVSNSWLLSNDALLSLCSKSLNLILKEFSESDTVLSLSIRPTNLLRTASPFGRCTNRKYVMDIQTNKARLPTAHNLSFLIFAIIAEQIIIHVDVTFHTSLISHSTGLNNEVSKYLFL